VERAVCAFHVELRKLLGAGDDAAVDRFIRAVSEVPTGGDADDLAKHGPGEWFGRLSAKQQDLTEAARTRVALLATARLAVKGDGDVEAVLTVEGRRGVRDWVATMHRALKSLLAGVHMSCGGPMRGSEYGHMHMMATAHGRPRDIYIVQGQVCVAPHYAKTSNRHEERLCPRFLPPLVGEAVVAWLRLLVPMRTFMVCQFGMDIDGCQSEHAQGEAMCWPCGGD
jgi:hypothetical protein